MNLSLRFLAFSKTLLVMISLNLAFSSHAGAYDLSQEYDRLLSRKPGQTEFLNLQQNYFSRGRGGPMPEPMSSAKSEGAQRAVQESDIYKIGAKNSKRLFLLNSYRGLQVIDFSQGTNQPQLEGRVAPTGNYPTDMYYFEGTNRILVLENNYFSNDGDYVYNRNQSRIVVYDVSNTQQPKIIKYIEVKGELADSRIVGDVLYLATSIRPDWRSNGNDTQSKGFVTSVNIPTLKVVQEQELSLPTSSRENMNIIEVAKEVSGVTKYNYYLVAVLSQSGWGWWDRQSLVELVDISDDEGAIKPVMTVSAKGFINERSQTQIKDGNLVVVSNFFTEATGNRNIARVAVETFALPTNSSEVIDANEAEFRRLNIDRQLKGLTGDDRDQKYKVLIDDAKLGLRKRFVKTENGKLRKPLADHVITVGDTTGLSANLQDVRWTGDSLYVFWVPQNNIDPFDLFDISDLKNGAKYIKRLQFDGWIERSIPLDFEGRQFVLGLGWVVENVNNDDMKRSPQVKLFEVFKRGAQTHILEVDTLTLNKGRVWTDFNAPDRFVETRFNNDGTGSILFSAYIADDSTGSASGAKLIGFDLKKAVAGETGVFRDGSFLKGDSGWLRRVFRNSEISAINTFSDEALGTFDVADGVGDTARVEQAVSVLELARNVVDFITLTDKANSFGFQIVQTGQPSYWWNANSKDTSKVEIRMVDLKNADAEIVDVIETLDTDGYFLSALKVNERSFWLVTKTNLPVVGDSPRKTEFQLRLMTLTDDGLVLTAEGTKIVEANQNGGGPIGRGGPFRYYDAGLELKKLDNEQLVAITGKDLFLINPTSPSVEFNQLDTSSCSLSEEQTHSLAILDGQLTISRSEIVGKLGRSTDDPTDTDDYYGSLWNLVKNSVSILKIEGSKANCSPFTNIPGKLIGVRDNNWITEDQIVLDILEVESNQEMPDGTTKKRYDYHVETTQTLDSLLSLSGEARLVDYYETGENYVGSMTKLADGTYAFFENDQNGYREYQKFVTVSFNRSLEIVKTVRAVQTDLNGTPNISGTFEFGDGKTLLFVTSGRQVQLMSLNSSLERPVVLELLSENKKVKKTVVPAYFYQRSGAGELNYSSANNSVEVPMGFSGVLQLKLAN